MDSTKYQTEEIENRTSSDPIFPPSAKLNSSHYTGSSVSLNTVNHNESTNSNLIQQEETVKSTEEEKPLTRIERIKHVLRLMRPTLEMIFFDVALPLALYYILKIWLSVLIALILSGIPPLLHVIYIFWKKRQLDILGCIFVVSFIISAVLSVLSGDVRLAMLRDSATTAIVSLMFLLSLIPLRTKWFTVRPLIFLFSQQMMSESPPIEWTDIEGGKHSVPLMEFVWKECRIFRKYCYILCILWGVLLMGEFVAKIIMIQSTLTVDQIVLYSNIIMIVVVVTMTIGTTIATRFIRKKTTAQIQQWKTENDFSERFSNK